MRAAKPAADSRGFNFFFFFKAGQERLEQETWSGAVKRQKESFFLNIFFKSLDAIKCPRYIYPIVLN